MIQTFGVLKNCTHKYIRLIDEQSKKQKSLNDSDDEMIIKNNNLIRIKIRIRYYILIG